MKLLALYYLSMSIVTFLAYALDKSAARRGAWRISERTLHGLALGGGWPGALLAQQVLRHKTSKTSFRTVFWCTVALNLLASALIGMTHDWDYPAPLRILTFTSSQGLSALSS